VRLRAVLYGNNVRINNNIRRYEDRVGSLQATERKNGKYLILVEDDAHARNLLFRWKP
jgi:hypothetical protein